MYEIFTPTVVMVLLAVGFLIGAALVVGVDLVNRSEQRQQTKRRMAQVPHDLGDPSCVLFDPYRFGNRGHCFWCCPDDHEGRGCLP